MSNGLFNIKQDTAISDKLLSIENIKKIEKLVQKDELTLEEINQLLYLLTTEESKLLNLDAYERYIFGKFYAWIREFVKLIEEIYRLENDLKNDNIYDSDLEKTIKKVLYISMHNVKFLIDVFLYLSRTSLSLDAEAFKKFLEQKFEYEYKTTPTQTPVKEEKPKFLFFKT